MDAPHSLGFSPTLGVESRGHFYVFLTPLLVGLVVRAVALPLPGTVDVTTFKIWTYNAATPGPA